MTVSAFGSAVPLLEVEGWVFLFSQTFLCSDFITHETHDTPFLRGSKGWFVWQLFSPSAQCSCDPSHCTAPSECMPGAEQLGRHWLIPDWGWCTHPLNQVRLQSCTPAAVVVRLKDAFLPAQSLPSTETSFSNLASSWLSTSAGLILEKQRRKRNKN